MSLFTKLNEAEISFGIAIIPTEPVKSQISKTSIIIAQKIKSWNIIDNNIFPSHLSLLLAGIKKEHISEFVSELMIQTNNFTDIEFLTNKLYSSFGGFIAVECKLDNNLRQLINIIISCFSKLHLKCPSYRPHIIKIWNSLSIEKRKLLKQYGTYKIANNLNPHLSVSGVDKNNINESLNIAREIINIHQSFKIDKFQFVDIGHENEKWDVLHEW